MQTGFTVNSEGSIKKKMDTEENPCPFGLLEREPQRKLDFTWVVCVCRNTKAAVPKRVVLATVNAATAIERWVVEHVKKFGPELILQLLCDGAVLVERKVQIP